MRELKILVGSLQSEFSALLQRDAESYARYYRLVTTQLCASADELLIAIAGGYDVVHLLAGVSSDGMLKGETGSAVHGTVLTRACCDHGVGLLWVASDNSAQAYISGFKASSVNLVMTIDRRGSQFSRFLEGLLRRMAEGQTMPEAWVSLCPQAAHDPRQNSLPVTIFSAGLPSQTRPTSRRL
jgi:hypothetical protein